MRIGFARAGVAALALAPSVALAHSFGQLYTLPVPVWMYLYGAAAALLVSFLIIGYFLGRPPVPPPAGVARQPLPLALNRLLAPTALTLLRSLSLGLLLLAIVSGLVGTPNPYANFNMTFFWIVIMLGYAYVVALLGNSYPLIHPWHGILASIDRLWRGAFAGRRAYPEKLGYAPALLLYMAFIWIELFGDTRPLSLALLLLAYAGITVIGAWWWGKTAWFRYGDFFGVFFRILGKIAPVAFIAGRLRWRPPFAGLLEERCERLSLLLFILFMLSSTAFDGLHETVPWAQLFWRELLPLWQMLARADATTASVAVGRIYTAYQSLALLLSPFAYLAVYAALLALAKRLTRSPLPLQALCLEFGYSLVPIAFVYHVTHYYTLLVGQGAQFLRLLSDPFGWGWNLLGTARAITGPVILDTAVVWHTQVGLILAGHIASVYLAHVVALRLFPTARMAVLSQLPMLALMMLYTTAGLWILAQPMQPGA